jgi:hypothetical protein
VVDAWRHRQLAKFDHLTTSDLRAVADASRPGRTSPVTGRRAPRTHSLALTVAVGMAGDDAGWRGRRGSTGRALVTRGLLSPQAAESIAQAKFEQLWLDGASRNDIAETLGRVCCTDR